MNEQKIQKLKTINGSTSVTVLVENTIAFASDLRGEHGIAFWIETGGNRLLFDTGQSPLFAENSEKMKIDLSQTDTIAISHGHFDHTGGLETALHTAPNANVDIHPTALLPKYSKTNGSLRYIGIPKNTLQALRQDETRLRVSKETHPLSDGIYITGEIPRETSYEDTGGAFFLDQEGRDPDPLIDDRAIFFDTSAGIVILSGCAHSGIVNTLQRISALTGNRPIHCVMGGFHLVNANEKRLHKTIEAFRRHNVQRIGLGHCTGINAIAAFWQAFPGRCFLCSTGSKIQFPYTAD